MKGYRDTMDQLRFTPEQKAHMTDRLMEASAASVRCPHTFRRVAAVGVAAALALSVGVAGATGALKDVGESFSAIFGPSAAQTEIIDQIGYPIGASATSGGVTITADAILGDTYSYAVVYTIQREDGKPLADPEALRPLNDTLPLSFTDSNTDVGHMGGMHGTAYFFDADPSDNSIQYVEMMTADEPILPGIAKVKFQDLNLKTGDGSSILLAEGTWRLKFDFNFEDAMITLPTGQDFTLNGMDATLNAVRISPLSYQVEYTVHDELQWDHDSVDGQQSEHDREELRRYFEALPLSLTFKDGTILDLSNSGGGISPEDGQTICEKSGLFSEILELDQIASITVGDVVIPVSQ